jgi:hypothetical protein
MSFKWPNKDPNEILDYSVDWSRWLNGATISTVVWYVDNASGVKTQVTAGNSVNGLTHVSSTNTNTVATIYLGAGTNNTEYKITCSITTSGGTTAERVVKIKIKEQ